MSYAAPKYKRTVRCGYCRQPGHNKSSCPQYATQVEDMRKEHGSDYWMVARYDAKKTRRKASGKSRKCSYCGVMGHNRKTCTTLKSDMFEVKARNSEYRKGLFNAMVKHGIFTGAIIKSDNHARCDELGTRWQVPMVIARVMWEHINIWEAEFRYYSSNIGERAPLQAKPINDITQKYAQNMGFPQDYDLLWNKMTIDVFEKYMGPDDDWYGRFKHNYFPTVVSPVNAEKPPLGWLTCDDTESQKTLKEFFKKRTSKDTYRSHTKGLTRDEEYELRKREMEDGYL
jgi:hypothetical protein